MRTQITDVLAATAEAIAAKPELAAAEVEAGARLVEGCRVEVRLGNRSVDFDMPAALGGSDRAPSPGQLALASLGACQAITYRIWSEKLGIQLDTVEVEVGGGIDARGLLGVDNSTRPGFDKVEVQVRLAGQDDPDRYNQLRQAVNEHCPLLDIFTNRVPVSTSLSLGEPRA
jgi:uncharacterized OsmC-like protein